MIRNLFAISIFAFSGSAVSWEAKCFYTNETIEVKWPESPFEVASNGNHELQFRFHGESEMRFGEVTEWLNRCSSENCLGSDIHTFELNTFDARGLLYCYPERY